MERIVHGLQILKGKGLDCLKHDVGGNLNPAITDLFLLKLSGCRKACT
jgi:hypothetical protein